MKGRILLRTQVPLISLPSLLLSASTNRLVYVTEYLAAGEPVAGDLGVGVEQERLSNSEEGAAEHGNHKAYIYKGAGPETQAIQSDADGEGYVYTELFECEVRYQQAGWEVEDNHQYAVHVV